MRQLAIKISLPLFCLLGTVLLSCVQHPKGTGALPGAGVPQATSGAVAPSPLAATSTGQDPYYPSPTYPYDSGTGGSTYTPPSQASQVAVTMSFGYDGPDGSLTYHYSVQNNTNSMLVSLSVGRMLNEEGNYAGMVSAKILTPSLDASIDASIDSSGLQHSLPGPTGWTGVATPVTKDGAGVELRWTAVDSSSGIPPGGSLDGFDVYVPWGSGQGNVSGPDATQDPELANSFVALFNAKNSSDLTQYTGTVSQPENYCMVASCPVVPGPQVTFGRHVVLAGSAPVVIPVYFSNLPGGAVYTQDAGSFGGTPLLTGNQINSLLPLGALPTRFEVLPDDNSNFAAAPRGAVRYHAASYYRCVNTDIPLLDGTGAFTVGCLWDQDQSTTLSTDNMTVVYHPADYITVGHYIPNFQPGIMSEPSSDASQWSYSFGDVGLPPSATYTPAGGNDDGFPLDQLGSQGSADWFDTSVALNACNATLSLPSIKPTASCLGQFMSVYQAAELSLELCLRIAAVPFEQEHTERFPVIQAKLKSLDALDAHLHRMALLYGVSDARVQSLIKKLAASDLDIKAKQTSIAVSLGDLIPVMQAQLEVAQNTIKDNKIMVNLMGCAQ